METNKGIIGLGLIVAIVLGILVVGGGAYYLGVKKNNKVVENNLPKENKNITTNNAVVPSDWKTYVDKENGFEFKYPPEIIFDPYSDSGIGFRGMANPPTDYANEPPDTLDSVADFDIKGYSHNGNTAIITYTKVDGQDAKVICGSKEGECIANITLPKPIKVGTYYNGHDRYLKFLVINPFFLKQKYVDQILSTFKFTYLSYNNSLK